MSLPANRGSRNYYNYFQDNVAYINDAGAAIPIGTFVGGQYNSSAPTYADGDPAVLQMTSAGRLMVDASLTLEGDVQIGAVELKDATSATRAKVKTDGTDNALVVVQNAPPPETNTVMDHGSNLDVGTVVEQMTVTSFSCKKGVVVKAAITNAGVIYIGNSDVTAGNNALTDGIPISAGEGVTMEIDNPNKLYAIASRAAQKVFWLAV